VIESAIASYHAFKLDLPACGKALMDGIKRQADLNGITHNLTGDAYFLNDFLEGIMGAGPNR